SATKAPRAAADLKWDGFDRMALRVMEMWAGYRKFSPGSRMQCLGSAVLRAVDRYRESSQLTRAVGWTFLQEIGWLPPWEIQARYSSPFPNVQMVRGGGYVRPSEDSLECLVDDVFAHSGRKDWSGITAYCIDSADAVDIDDAI